ncbi:MAG TPA: hypothetical protein VEU08_09405 [Vicinamibacterales bacterium]|nr:hypothetical protein [Vicinamibacterales bacterium]
MTAEVPRAIAWLARLIPDGDRDWVLGDLVEAAGDRGLRGARRGWWMAAECGSIAAGLTAERTRGWFVRRGAGTLVGAVLFCGSIAVFVIGVDLLVGSFLAAGF